MLLLLIVTAVLALFHWRPPAGLWFLAGGLTVFVVADMVYLFHAANGTYQPGGINDALWVLATLLMAFGAWAGRSGRPGFVLPAWRCSASRSARRWSPSPCWSTTQLPSAAPDRGRPGRRRRSSRPSAG